MKRFVLALLVMIGVGSLASAGSYAVGFVDSNGYTFLDDGRWHRGANSYYRTAVYHAGFGSYGCYGYQASYYTYEYELYNPPFVPAKLPASTDPGWRTRLLEIAAARDKYEAEIRKGQFEHQQYLEAVNALGLRAPTPFYPAGFNPAFAPGGYQFSGSTTTQFGANGNTQYGYNQTAAVYGDANLSTLYQQAAQLTQQAQALGGQANGNFQGLVGQEGSNQARVKEIIAKGQLAMQVFNSLGVGPTTETKQFTFKVDKAGHFERDDSHVEPEVRAKLGGEFKALATARCASCHGGDKPRGGFDISTYSSLPLERKQAIWLRLNTPDDAKAMPRAEGGGVGKRLTPEEFRLFVLN